MSRLRVISYGGGVQSTALLVLASQGRIDFPVALFANVGDDAEHPATLDYVRDVATPWAVARGVQVLELHRVDRAGERETLLQRVTQPDKALVTMPLRGENGAPLARECTKDFKVRVVGRWLREHGATSKDPAQIAIGFSVDEIERSSKRNDSTREHRVYPLLDLGLSRADCAQLIRNAGLPVPPKSACWFCPFHSPQAWAEMRRDEPVLFDKSVALERTINERQANLGKRAVWLTRFARPLNEAITAAQTPLFAGDGPESCDEGACWT